MVRKEHGKHAAPTAAILDSQSVKSDGHGGDLGYAATKRIKGRKRHLLVDTLGCYGDRQVRAGSVLEHGGKSRKDSRRKLG
jgi:hypothetical protein